MKKRVLSLVLALACLLSGMVVAQAVGNTYTINSTADLRTLAQRVNAGESFSKVTLNADIQLNSNVITENGELNAGNFAAWTPIGTTQHPFTGTFNGNGHTITGLYIDDNTASNQGLFGVVSSAVIYNVTVSNSYIAVKENAGAVVGYAKSDTVISNCRSQNNRIQTSSRSGGVVGWTSQSDVYNCTNSSYCYSTRCSGGIVGDVYSDGNIYNCVNNGTIDGGSLVGGLSGGSTTARITNCLNTGSVNGYLMAGGGGTRTLTNCYSLKNDTINSGCSMGTNSATAVTFADARAVLDSAVTVDGASYTTVLAAMNAWVAAQTDGIYYSKWDQGSSYPYLRDIVIPTVRNMSEDTFDDVDLKDWFYDPVKQVYDENLMTGTGERTFEPNTTVSRAQVVQMLYNKEGRPAVSGNPVFTDVSNTSVWYYNAIQWAGTNDVADGVGNGKFDPNAKVTREQFAQFLYNYTNKPSVSGSVDFPDKNNISDWAVTAITWANQKGIISGKKMNNGTIVLDPKAYASRAEAASMLRGYMKVY